MKPQLLIFPLLALTLLLTASCEKKSPSATTSTSSSSTSTLPHTPLISLRYQITYAEMEERTTVYTVDNDPFTDIGLKPCIMQPAKLLARTGLPLPKGSTITHNGSYLFLTAPPAYQEQVATLLDLTGAPYHQ